MLRKAQRASACLARGYGRPLVVMRQWPQSILLRLRFCREGSGPGDETDLNRNTRGADEARDGGHRRVVKCTPDDDDDSNPRVLWADAAERLPDTLGFNLSDGPMHQALSLSCLQMRKRRQGEGRQLAEVTQRVSCGLRPEHR